MDFFFREVNRLLLNSAVPDLAVGKFFRNFQRLMTIRLDFLGFNI